jgi:ketosteroid isomerase-like protein
METQEEVFDRDAISEEINMVMQDYSGNWNENADALLKHYYNSPDFIFYSDGKFWDYVAWEKNIHALFSVGFTSEGDPYKEPQIRVLCPEAAFFTSSLDYVMTDSSGVKYQVNGAVTYILVRDGETWKIIHGIADHESIMIEE